MHRNTLCCNCENHFFSALAGTHTHLGITRIKKEKKSVRVKNSGDNNLKQKVNKRERKRIKIEKRNPPSF